MGRLILFYSICIICISCNSIENKYNEKDLVTIFKDSNYVFSLIKETETSNFKNTQLVVLKDKSILTSVDLGDNNLYLFCSKRSDTIGVIKLVMVKMQDIEKFKPDTVFTNLSPFNFEIVSVPFFGSIDHGLPKLNIAKSFEDDNHLVIQSKENKLNKYSLKNIFFRGDAIYYYEYKDNLLASSFIGYEKKLHDDYRPFR